MISIHALREEGDWNLSVPEDKKDSFLSTPSARRATESASNGFDLTVISIHALREEGDVASSTRIARPFAFLSTPSARRATVNVHAPDIDVNISIHALREEGDRPNMAARTCARHFYPRPPRGGRLTASYGTVKSPAFLSTPSARRATSSSGCRPRQNGISIHALREEGDVLKWAVKADGQKISIHALREEGDQRSSYMSFVTAAFLSTPSARRATIKF